MKNAPLTLQKHDQRMKAFRFFHSEKTMRVTLKETGIARQELPVAEAGLNVYPGHLQRHHNLHNTE